MYFIGIDLGTSSIKMLLVNETGKVVNTVSEEYPIYYPKPGFSEQNPQDWIKAVMKGIPRLLDGFNRNEVEGIGVAGQMHGLVILDENDEVIRPAILWNDGRTTEETDYLNQVIGGEKLSEYTANIAFAGFTAPKILWMKENEPQKFAAIKQVMLPKDYLNYRLTGVLATDVSEASGTLYFDVKNRCWSEEMLAVCGINKDMLPAVFESYEPIGHVKKDLWQRILSAAGLSQEVTEETATPVVCAGAGDNAAAAVSCGAVRVGDVNLSVGTSGTVFITGEHFTDMKNHAIHSFCDSTGRYHLMGCMLSAASCNSWWMEDILKTGDYAGEQQAIPEDLLGENREFFLPYLMGERSPHNDESARGAFIGMRRDTRRSEMTLAMLEGVAFGLRDSLDAAREAGIFADHATICGGGVKSRLWQRIIANILNVRLDILEREEGPSLGGAILAAVCDGAYPDVETACGTIVRKTDSVESDPDIAARYDDRYATYRSLYPALKDCFKNM